jgi:hypothetical protein
VLNKIKFSTFLYIYNLKKGFVNCEIFILKSVAGVVPSFYYIYIVDYISCLILSSCGMQKIVHDQRVIDYFACW